MKQAVFSLLLFFSVGLSAQSSMLDFAGSLPADAAFTFVSADLDQLHGRLKQLSAWKYYFRLTRGKQLLDSMSEQLEGLGAAGLKPEILLKLFGNDYALSVFNYNMAAPEFCFTLSTRGQKEYFDEIFQSIQITAIVYGIPLLKETYKGVTIISLTSNFHYADAGRIYFLGNRKESLKRCMDAQMDKVNILVADTNFKAIRKNALPGTDFYVFVREPSRFKEFSAYDVDSLLVTGKVLDRFDFRLTLAGATNSRFIQQVRKNALPANMMQFVPFYSYYARALNMECSDDYPSWSMKIPVLKENRSDRNMAFFKDFSGRTKDVFKEEALLLCIPYQTSTNYCFIFELKQDLKESDLLTKLWPDKNLKKTGVANRVVYYYDEKGNEDTFNYAVREGSFVIISDALNMISASLSSKDGVNRILDSETFKYARNNTASPKHISYVFNSMRWVNVEFSDTHFEFVESLKNISSFVTMSWQEIKDRDFYGANIQIKAFPKINTAPVVKKK